MECIEYVIEGGGRTRTLLFGKCAFLFQNIESTFCNSIEVVVDNRTGVEVVYARHASSVRAGGLEERRQEMPTSSG